MVSKESSDDYMCFMGLTDPINDPFMPIYPFHLKVEGFSGDFEGFLSYIQNVIQLNISKYKSSVQQVWMK